jgi:hypothetical protein
MELNIPQDILSVLGRPLVNQPIVAISRKVTAPSLEGSEGAIDLCAPEFAYSPKALIIQFTGRVWLFLNISSPG